MSLNYDDNTIISDITDVDGNGTITSLDFETRLSEIKIRLNSELAKLTLDTLKDKCKELSISGLSKLKKPELIETLETEFCKQVPILKDKKLNDLKNICKLYGIKGVATSKKEVLICQILSHNSANLKFTLEDTGQTPQSKPEVEKEEKPKLSLLEQLEKQKQEIECKLKEEIERKEEEEKKLREEEERRQKEEEKKQKEEEDRKKEEEKREQKKKKQSIPKNVRMIVWNHYIGEDIIKHKCLCCKKVTISNTNFEVGHVMSEKNGGTHEINNLRPICFSCNHSMGTENMVDFVVKFGLYIG